MEEKTMYVNISACPNGTDSWYESGIELPAEEHEITDALHKARVTGDNDFIEYVIHGCDRMPSIQGKRLDSSSIYELDFLAGRLATLSEEEQIVLKAIERKHVPQEEDALLDVKDLINLTYGLDKVPILSNVTNVKELGEFAMENDLSPLEIDVPKEFYQYLDFMQIGNLVQDIEDGEFVEDKYIPTADYEKQEVYNGQSLPTEDKHTNYVFGLEVSKPPENEDIIEDAIENAKWIYLPMDKEQVDDFMKETGVKEMADCVYFGFKSAIPQVESDHFDDMQNFTKLNSLADMYLQMTPSDQVKFKAVLSAEEPAKIEQMLDIARNLKQYELATEVVTPEHFYRSYLERHMDDKLDKAWIEKLYIRSEGDKLLERLGATVTDYGVISARGDYVYKSVMFNNYDYPLLTEKFDLIEINDKTVLFANERINPSDIPKGLIKYDLRSGENTDFASIERKVTVNHSGTILVKEPFDFDGKDAIILTDETSPNFLGDEVSVREFMETDYEQQEELTQKMGGV